MASPAESLRTALASGMRGIVRGARLAVGIPDYAVYCEHMRTAHPESVPMDRDTFFRDRMDARYARGRSRCC